MRGDNESLWAVRAKPLIAFLRAAPRTRAEVHQWSYGAKVGGERMGVTMAEECLCWLEARGVVVRGDDRKWRLK